MEADQRTFEGDAERLQQELHQQTEFLRARLAKQEGETEALKRQLEEQAALALKAQEDMQKQLSEAQVQAQQVQQQVGLLLKEKEQLEAAASERSSRHKAELARRHGYQQEALLQREHELQRLQRELQQHAERIEAIALSEKAYAAEAECLRKDVAALELGLHAEREETQRLLAVKDEERRQLELAQQAALAAMQQQVEQLKRERSALIDEAAANASKARQEYSGLLQAMQGLRKQNASLSAQLYAARVGQAHESHQLLKKQASLLGSLRETEEKYLTLQQLLQRSTAEYHKALEEAQRQLGDLKPQLEALASYGGKRVQFRQRANEAQETDQHAVGVHNEPEKTSGPPTPSEALATAGSSPEPVDFEAGLRNQRDELAQQVEWLHAKLRAKDVESAQALQEAEDSQKVIQRLLSSLEDQRRRVDDYEQLRHGRKGEQLLFRNFLL